MKIVLQIVFVVLLAQQVLSDVKNLNSTVALGACATQCSWSTPDIWTGGTAPVSSDTVDIQVDGTYKIVVDSDVTIADFQIGYSDDSHGSQYLVITNGATFISNGNFQTLLSVSVQVNTSATLHCPNQGTVNGYFQLSGSAYFGGSSPSLYVDSTDLQLSFSFVTGQLEFDNGFLVVTDNLQISTTSTLTGNGHINGSVQLNGNFAPGLGGVGTFYINGDLYFDTLSDLQIDVASESSYDHIILTGTCDEDGEVTVSPQGSYEPLAHTQFYILNYTAQRDGFDLVRGTGFIALLEDKWEAIVDQSYTSLVYDSASSVLISFVMIAACVLFTTL